MYNIGNVLIAAESHVLKWQMVSHIRYVNFTSIKIQKGRWPEIPRSVFFQRKSSVSLLSSLKKESVLSVSGRGPSGPASPKQSGTLEVTRHPKAESERTEDTHTHTHGKRKQRGFLSLWTNSARHFRSHLNIMKMIL